MIFFLNTLIVLLFLAAAALALFFLYIVFLPTLHQQGVFTDSTLATPVLEPIPTSLGVDMYSRGDFLPSRHNSHKDCKVLEAIYDYAYDRKAICVAFEGCMYTCPRLKINFSALMEGPFPEVEEKEDIEDIIAAASCKYRKEGEWPLAGIAAGIIKTVVSAINRGVRKAQILYTVRRKDTGDAG